MYENNGCGLAAPQVGIRKRIVVIDVDDGNQYVMINPEILEEEGTQTGQEGCLSVPGVWGRVVRPMYVKISAQDEKGEAFEDEGEGLIAEAFEHEYDHLDGVLFDEKIYEYVDVKDRDGGDEEDEE